LATYGSLAVLIFSGFCNAQSISDHLVIPLSDSSRPVVLKIALAAGSITVRGYDGSRVIADAILQSGKGGPSNKQDGTITEGEPIVPGTGLRAEEENNAVTISAGPSAESKRIDVTRAMDLTVRVPRNASIKASTHALGNIEIHNVAGDLEASDDNGDVVMSGVSGSAVVDVLNGNIVVSFAGVDPQKGMSFSVLTGKIDVTFPPDLKATFLMRTEGGEMYSDFPVKIEKYLEGSGGEIETGKGKYRIPVKNGARGTVNGGGAEIQFNNFTGDTYIRKLK
jgi:hypothetical protein